MRDEFQTLDLYVLNGATGATIARADIGFTPENAPIVAEIDEDWIQVMEAISNHVLDVEKKNVRSLENLNFVMFTCC